MAKLCSDCLINLIRGSEDKFQFIAQKLNENEFGGCQLKNEQGCNGVSKYRVILKP
jgi:hypothetical protein